MLKKLAGSALAAAVLVGGMGAAAVAGLHVAEREEPVSGAIAKRVAAPTARSASKPAAAQGHRWDAACAAAKTEADALIVLAPMQTREDVTALVRSGVDIGVRLLATFRDDAPRTRHERALVAALDANLAWSIEAVAEWQRSYSQDELARWVRRDARDNARLAALAQRIGAADCVELFT